MRGSSDLMAHSGDKDTQKPEQLMQQCRRLQYRQQQQQVDLPRAPQDCTPRAQDNTVATLLQYDPRPRSRHHRYHGGGAGTILNRLTKPKEVT